jgi:uncharacterized protein YkwD
MRSRPALLARRIALVVGLLVGPGLVTTAAPAQASTSAATTLYEYQVVNAINAQRAKYYRARLWLSPCPQQFADRWAPYMVWYFVHQPMLPILQGCHATVAAENLAFGNVSASKIVDAWMASPGHRANILDGRLNRIGVAAVYSRGRWNVVADFTRS